MSATQTKKSASTGAAASKAARASPAEEIAALVRAGGFALFLLFAAVYFSTYARLAYRIALLGQVAASAAELFALYTRSSNDAAVLSTAEEMPLALMAVALYVFRPCGAALVAPAIRAFFGIVAWARAAPQVRTSAALRTHVLPSLETVAAVQPQALQAAAGAEVLALPWMVLTFWRTGFALPAAYFAYLRWQHGLSPRTRVAVASLDDSLTRLTAHPQMPPAVRSAYASVRSALARQAVHPAAN